MIINNERHQIDNSGSSNIKRHKNKMRAKYDD